MGGVWCKADKSPTRSYTTKGHINATITRWTDHVRQAYRKPKTHHRPPRPPQKPLRTHGRLTISHPQLVKEDSSDGWRTATLMVPPTESAPVPPPRKKRKRNQDLARTAYSMDNLNIHGGFLNTSTMSLPDKYPSETGLDSKSSSSTLVVTPVLEARFDHSRGIDEVDEKQDDDKENIGTNKNSKIEEEEEELESEGTADVIDEIIPIEKETLFSSRTLLQSNLGYVDQLSAISEASAESGFDDKTDICKSSERSESVASSESMYQEPGLFILAHIHNISSVSQFNEASNDVKEKTAISKKEWLQNILKEESEPYFISRDSSKSSRRGSDSLTLTERAVDTSGQPCSLPTDHLHLMNRETETSVADYGANKTPPPSPDPGTNPSPIYDTAGTNHSVLLALLQENSLPTDESISSNPFVQKEESIFLTNTKTNIIYKSLSSDRLTDDYNIDYLDTEESIETQNNLSSEKPEDVLKSAPMMERNCALDSTNPFNDSTSKSHLSDYSFQTPKLVESDPGLNSLSEDKRSNVVSSFDFKELIKSQNYVTALKDLQLSETKAPTEDKPDILVNGVVCDSQCLPITVTDSIKNGLAEKKDDEKLHVKEPLVHKDSLSSSRRSSITDSLHEFEMSIYDMLKESKKNRDSSDEEDSLKPVKTETRQ